MSRAPSIYVRSGSPQSNTFEPGAMSVDGTGKASSDPMAWGCPKSCLILTLNGFRALPNPFPRLALPPRERPPKRDEPGVFIAPNKPPPGAGGFTAPNNPPEGAGGITPPNSPPVPPKRDCFC